MRKKLEQILRFERLTDISKAQKKSSGALQIANFKLISKKIAKIIFRDRLKGGIQIA